jgi:micrococcal nuclease
VVSLLVALAILGVGALKAWWDRSHALPPRLAEGGVTIRDLGEDKYGRLLGTVATRTTPNVSEALIVKGLGRRYDGGHRGGWC